MAYDIITYDPSGNDGTEALGDGHGRPNFPPNYKAGREDLSWSTDLLSDPADPRNNSNPLTGYDLPGQRTGEI